MVGREFHGDQGSGRQVQPFGSPLLLGHLAGRDGPAEVEGADVRLPVSTGVEKVSDAFFHPAMVQEPKQDWTWPHNWQSPYQCLSIL